MKVMFVFIRVTLADESYGKTYFDLIYKLECDLNMKLPLDLKNKLCGWKIIYERRAGWKLI